MGKTEVNALRGVSLNIKRGEFLAMIVPKIMPITPPVTLIKTVSFRNWARISLFVAPVALLMPISLKRSVTLASIIFIIPMPTSKLDGKEDLNWNYPQYI